MRLGWQLQLLTLFSFIQAQAHGATVYVSPGAGTLQTAADASAPGDVLVLADGTYTGGGAASIWGYVVTINKPVTIRAANVGQAVIDGEGGRRALKCSDSCALSGLNITNGMAANYWGGGVEIWAGSNAVIVSIDLCNIDSNKAKTGAGLYMKQSGSGTASVNITRSKIVNNFGPQTSSQNLGAGVYIDSGNLEATDVDISYNTFVYMGSGAGIYQAGGHAVFDSCQINYNGPAQNGGGYYWAGGTAVFRDSELLGNTAQYNGAAYYVANGLPSGALALMCTATDGEAPMYGQSVDIVACSPSQPPSPPVALSPPPRPSSAANTSAGTASVTVESGGTISIATNGKLVIG